MDFQIKGRTWVGNIYHKIEAICQEVDDYVTNKDSVKYVETQVQTVGESMKNFYSNVVHDFLPPLVDNEQTEAHTVAKNQNDAIGTYIRSMVGIKGKHGHASEMQTSKDHDTVNLVNCNSHGLAHQRQLDTHTQYPDSHEERETDTYIEKSGDSSIYKSTQMVVEENITEEGCKVPRYVRSADGNSSLNWTEEHPLAKNLDSPEDENLSGSSKVSNDRDQRSIIPAKFSPINADEDLGFKTSQNNKKISNSNDLCKVVTGFSLEQDSFSAMDSDTGAKESVTNREHLMSEGESSSKEKGLFVFPLCTDEQHQVAAQLQFLQHENSMAFCSANEDEESSIKGKLPPAILNHDTRPGVVGVEERVCDNRVPSEDAGTELLFEGYGDMEKCGTSLEEGNGSKDGPLVVEYTSFPLYKNYNKLSMCSQEENPAIEELSTLEDENLSESSLTPTGENHKVTVPGKLPSPTSVHDGALRAFQLEDRECQISSPYKDAETDFSLETDDDRAYMDPHLTAGENHIAEKYALEEFISSVEQKSSCDLPVCLTELHREAEKLNCSEHENLSESSVILHDDDHKLSVLADLSPAISVHDSGLMTSQKDETICNSRLDVLSTSPSSELVTLSKCSEKKEDETEISSSRSSMSMEPLNLPEVLLTNYVQKAEKSCSCYTDSIASVSNLSGISSIPSSDLSFDNMVVNRVSASPITAFSAEREDTSRTNEMVANAMLETSQDKHEKFWHEEDSAVDTADLDMETIDLSDNVKLDESCIFVDNKLPYAASARPRKFRSYKKLIHDAFASRKRLIKEYEQLAIWYGDIDTETTLHPTQSVLPPSPNTESRYSRSLGTSDVYDPEWELL